MSQVNSFESLIRTHMPYYLLTEDILIELDTQSIDIDVESISSQKEI